MSMPLSRVRFIRFAGVIAMAAAVGATEIGHAATYTWTSGDGNWFSSGQTLSGNWTPSGGTLTPADSLVFDLASLAYQINQNGNAQVTNLTVSGDPIVEFRDSPLTISGSLVTQGTVAFYNSVGFVNGAVVDTNNLALYRLVGAGNFTTRGTLGIYDQASYSGTMTISQGTVEVLDTVFGGNIVNNGGMFSNGRGSVLAGSYVQSSGTGTFYDRVVSMNQTGGVMRFGGNGLGESIVESLAGSGGTIDVPSSAVTLIIGDASATTYAGSIVGDGSISKVGSGSLSLGGTSTYTGATTVSAGRLLVNGALGNSPVTVLAAAELGGSGAIGGPVSVAAGGTLSPGSSIESLATGTATFAAGATFAYEVDSTNPLSLGSAADLLVVSGNLNLDTGNATILTVADLAGSPSPFVNHTTIFALINYSGTWNGGLFTYGGSVLADGDTFTVGSQDWLIDYNRTSAGGLANFSGDYLPSSSFVTITAVPEPSTVGMALAGIACGGFSMWWRKWGNKKRSAVVGASLLLGVACLCIDPVHAVTIDWVTVGDPGNTADTSGDPNPAGAVADSFQIMKYEFTNQQYTDFLNSVDPTGINPNSVYNANMGSNARGGITNLGTTDGSRYAVKSNMGDKPVNFVSWFDAARVANWLMNGATGTSSTETGAYTLVGGQTSGTAPARNSGATFYIPTEDQWYKAAYYKGGSTNAGYWDYATQSDTAPTAVTADESGIGSAGGTGNFANYRSAADWNSQDGNVTTVGTNGGASVYGAFDMSGNLFEWNDLTGVAGDERGLRGGRFGGTRFDLSSSSRYATAASDQSQNNGFRLAGAAPIPEIDPAGLGSVLALVTGTLGLLERRRRRAA